MAKQTHHQTRRTSMDDFQIIDLTPENISDYGLCGYKAVAQHPELQKKVAWFKDYYPHGLKIKVIITQDGDYQGMIEYLPGELAHRPVNAAGYTFIHCLFAGFRKTDKRRGYASALLQACISDAKSLNTKGVAVVTRKGAFMIDKKIFIKHGFEKVSKASPDFELVAMRFDTETPLPSFRAEALSQPYRCAADIGIVRSPQCPYTEKNIDEVITLAHKKYQLSTELIDLKGHTEAQDSHCAFGTFCLTYQGGIISHHPVSKARFETLMRSRL